MPVLIENTGEIVILLVNKNDFKRANKGILLYFLHVSANINIKIYFNTNMYTFFYIIHEFPFFLITNANFLIKLLKGQQQNNIETSNILKTENLGKMLHNK